MRVFSSTNRMARVSSDNGNIAVEHQEPAEVLSHLGDTSTPQITGSKIVASVPACGVLVAASGVYQLHFMRHIHDGIVCIMRPVLCQRWQYKYVQI